MTRGHPRQVRATGAEALRLAIDLLRRARLADPSGGVWEAADLAWWWRMPRASDTVSQRFWVDDAGPIAVALLTAWPNTWACDVVRVAGADVDLHAAWSAALAAIDQQSLSAVESLVPADDAPTAALLESRGWVARETSGSGWLNAPDRPPVNPPPSGYRIVDRARRPGSVHPMVARNGPEVEARLQATGLYDPALDLATIASDGSVAGYALFWNDRVTGVGLVEPMRVEDAHTRRGIGRALLTTGLDRLAQAGARRLKVGWVSERARALYLAAGFRESATLVSYAWRRPS
jgi:GNAT superfamily N-acetyltransferase